MDKLLASINTRINYILSNSDNAFIAKTCGVINDKMEYIKNRTYSKRETVQDLCDQIINYDIANMKGVGGQTNMVYKKMDELADFVSQIPDAYFEEA